MEIKIFFSISVPCFQSKLLLCCSRAKIIQWEKYVYVYFFKSLIWYLSCVIPHIGESCLLMEFKYILISLQRKLVLNHSKIRKSRVRTRIKQTRGSALKHEVIHIAQTCRCFWWNLLIALESNEITFTAFYYSFMSLKKSRIKKPL